MSISVSLRSTSPLLKPIALLVCSHETYSFIYRNCEHAAFAFNPKRPVWVSPQVPYLLWNTFRVSVNACSIYFLVNNKVRLQCAL